MFGSPSRHAVLARLRPRTTVRTARSGPAARWPRLLHRHRVLLAALLTAAAVTTAVGEVAAARRTVDVLVVTGDLGAGDPLPAGAVRTVAVPAQTVPDGLLTAVPAGARLTSGIRSGEILTDARVSGSGLPQLPPGSAVVAVPVDAALLPWLGPGSRLSLSAPPDPLHPGGDGLSSPAAVDAHVVAVEPDLPPRTTMAGGSPQITLVVGVSSRDARHLAQWAGRGSLFPVLLP